MTDLNAIKGLIYSKLRVAKETLELTFDQKMSNEKKRQLYLQNVQAKNAENETKT